MKKSLITTVVMFLVFCGTARAGVLDSLRNNVRIAKNDTEKYNANLSLGAYYYDRDCDISHKYFWKALLYAKRLHDKSKISVTYINIATLYSIGYQFKPAVDTLILAIRLAKEINHLEETAFGYSQLGTIYSRIGDYEKSLDAFNSAVAIMNRSAVEDSLRKYRAQGKITLRQDSYLTSVSVIYNDLAMTHLQIKDTAEAISVLKFSLKVAEASLQEERAAVGYANIGEIYSGMGKFRLPRNI